MKWQWQCQGGKKKQKGIWWGGKAKGHLPLFKYIEKIQMEATRVHVQLSDGICLRFSLTFFSHWVIQNYNMNAALVLQILRGITSPLCSHAILQRRVTRKAFKFKNFTQNKCPWYWSGSFHLLKCFYYFIILYWIY